MEQTTITEEFTERMQQINQQWGIGSRKTEDEAGN
jgi:hypothetical protein